jgi:hypothetical protein
MTSLPGLTRQSIIPSKDLFPMDVRVKPRMTIWTIGILKQKGPGKTGAFDLVTRRQSKSARIEFNDQMRLHLDRERHVRQSGDAGELCRHLGVIDFEEIGHVALGKLNGFQNGSELF